MAEAYKERIDVLQATPAATKTQMNSGRYIGSITAEAFASSTLNQLGWVRETRGNWYHASMPFIHRIPIVGWYIRHENKKRWDAWQAEEKAKAEAAKK